MSNLYFDWPAKSTGQRFVRFTTVRSADVNASLDEVSAGFERLPAPPSLWGSIQNYGEASGSVNAWAATIAGTYLTGLTDGLQVRVKMPAANTIGAPTFNLNGLGAKAIVRDTGVALSQSDITADMVCTLTYNADYGQWQLAQTPISGTASDINAAALAASSGAGFLGFSHAVAYASGTLGAKGRDFVSVKDAPFNAKGDGVTDDTAAIQAAFNAASAGTVVVFPKTSVGYKISNNISVPLNVHLSGPGKVLRTHALAVNNYGFTLAGGNRVDGLAYDGGALTIVAPGLALSIKDFRCNGDNVEFSGCTFDNSCGSFIEFADDQYAIAAIIMGLIVRGCRFGDYFDHSIYCQGYKLVETGDINITGNTFIGRAVTTTRQAVKLKNVCRATVASNSWELPTGSFITVEVGLDGIECRDTEDISIVGNVGKGFRFVESVADVTALNRGYMIRRLTISGNTATCTGDTICLGLNPDMPTTYATRADGVTVTNNVLKGRYFIVNGDINGVNNGISNLVIADNVMYGTGNTLLLTYGNIETLMANRNIGYTSAAYNVNNALMNRAYCCDVSLIPTIAGVFEISDNMLTGNFGSFISEQPAGAFTSINFTCHLRNNRNIGNNASKRMVVLTSTVIGAATGVIYAEGNKSIGGSAAASACTNKALVLETDSSKRYVDPASTADKQFGYFAQYMCSADLGFDPLGLGAGIYYNAYRKADGTYVRVA